ncbi:MAG: methyltransferase domain-containing protein [Actinomycetota bacterium]
MNTSDTSNTDDIHEDVRSYYRAAADRATGATDEAADGTTDRPAVASADTTETDDVWGAGLYDDETLAEGSDAAAGLSMGCGNPFAVADLRPGETVLDLGSGGGLDVIVSARRVAPDGKAYGVDFLPEMLELARKNAAEAGVDNVEFLEGMIEDVPLPDGSIDVIISNCVINLAPDKHPVLGEMARLLKPGGRVAVSDVVAEDGFVPPTGGDEWAECGAGGLERTRYLDLLREVGLVDASIELTHETTPGLHAAIVRATKPAGG